MSTTDVKTPPNLNTAEARELRAFQGTVEGELRLLALGGLTGTARFQELQEIRTGLRETLEAWHREQARLTSERDRAEAGQRKALEAREKVAREEREKAGVFLADALSRGPVEREVLEEQAGVQGIGQAALLQGAGDLTLKRGRRYGTGNRVTGPEYWAKSFLAGYGEVRPL